jgi:tetratricopeptide (TPR) repeat protein
MDEAFAVIDRAEDLAGEAPVWVSVTLKVQRMWLLSLAGEWDRVIALAEPTADTAVESGLAPAAGQVYGLLGQALQARGDFAGAGDAVGRAIALIDDPRIAADLRITRANLLARTDRSGEVLGDLVEVVAERTAAGDGLGAALARHPLAIAYLNLDRLLDAAEVAEEELGYLLAHPGAGDPIPVRYLLATIYQRLDQPDEAIAALAAIAADCDASGNRGGLAQMAEEIGDILDRLNRDAEAAARYLEAAQAFHEVGASLEELRNRRRHAIGLHWAHQPGDAVAALAAADAFAAGLPDELGAHLTWERALLDHDAARILWGAERHGDAAERVTRSAVGFRSIEALPQAVTADLLLAEILLDDGAPVPAEAVVRRALALVNPGEGRRPRMVALLAATLRAQERPEDAAAVWAEFGVPRPTTDD